MERSSRLRTGAYVLGFNNKEVTDDTSESSFTELELMKSRQTVYSLVVQGKKQGSRCRGKTKSREGCLSPGESYTYFQVKRKESEELDSLQLRTVRVLIHVFTCKCLFGMFFASGAVLGT